jgi:hypothetical protein
MARTAEDSTVRDLPKLGRCHERFPVTDGRRVDESKRVPRIYGTERLDRTVTMCKNVNYQGYSLSDQKEWIRAGFRRTQPILKHRAIEDLEVAFRQ